MKKRRWLRWTLLGIVLALLGIGIWLKSVIADQPVEPVDPGIPEVLDLPDPEDVE